MKTALDNQGTNSANTKTKPQPNTPIYTTAPPSRPTQTESQTNTQPPRQATKRQKKKTKRVTTLVPRRSARTSHKHRARYNPRTGQQSTNLDDVDHLLVGLASDGGTHTSDTLASDGGTHTSGNALVAQGLSTHTAAAVVTPPAAEHIAGTCGHLAHGINGRGGS